MAERIAPTRPHPRAPDTPPAVAAGVGAALLDRAGDASRSGAGKARQRVARSSKDGS